MAEPLSELALKFFQAGASDALRDFGGDASRLPADVDEAVHKEAVSYRGTLTHVIREYCSVPELANAEVRRFLGMLPKLKEPLSDSFVALAMLEETEKVLRLLMMNTLQEQGDTPDSNFLDSPWENDDLEALDSDFRRFQEARAKVLATLPPSAVFQLATCDIVIGILQASSGNSALTARAILDPREDCLFPRLQPLLERQVTTRRAVADLMLRVVRLRDCIELEEDEEA